MVDCNWNPHRSAGVLVGMLAVCVLVVSGCRLSFVGILGSGNRQTETRDVAAFDQIEVHGSATVHVRFGSTPALVVSTDDNLLPYVLTTVDDGKLNIRFKSPINPRSGLIIDVTTADLKRADVSGAATLKLEDAKLDRFELNSSGASEFMANGVVGELDMTVNGAADIDTQALQAKSVRLSISGAAGANVFASQRLDVKVSGAGAVTYYGNPANVTKSVSGVGSVTSGESETDRHP